jgi:hypothetical protein
MPLGWVALQVAGQMACESIHMYGFGVREEHIGTARKRRYESIQNLLFFGAVASLFMYRTLYYCWSVATYLRIIFAIIDAVASLINDKF